MEVYIYLGHLGTDLGTKHSLLEDPLGGEVTTTRVEWGPVPEDVCTQLNLGAVSRLPLCFGKAWSQWNLGKKGQPRAGEGNGGDERHLTSYSWENLRPSLALRRSMLSARSVIGMGGWSRIPGEAGHTTEVTARPGQGGGDSPNACMCTGEHM